MPMFVVLIPFIVGILLYDYVEVELWLASSLMLVAVVAALFTLRRGIGWLYVFVALAMFGYVVTELHREDVQMPTMQPIDMDVEVVGEPAQRDGYRVAEGRVLSWSSGGVAHDSDYTVQLWIRSDTVRHGDVLHLFSELNPRISRHESYDRLMHRRGYVGGVSVADYNIIALDRHAPTTLQSQAVAKFRSLYADSDSDADAVAMVEAMTLGSRVNISPELRDAYSRTGLAHLVAISGLHLGIVAMVIATLLLPLNLIHRGHMLRNVLIIVALWLFVAIGGASASLVRAAVMFTVLQLALMWSRNYNALNSLSAAIFAMLVYCPNYLYDVSFQLSVMAVMGIVVWAVPLVRTLPRRSVVERWVLSTAAVGIVATLWTMPIVSHTFGNIPIIGIGVTPLLLFTAYVVVVCGVVMLLLPAALSLPFAWGAEWAAELQNEITLRAADYSWASIDYALSGEGVAVCYALYAIVTCLLWSYSDHKVIKLVEYDDYK